MAKRLRFIASKIDASSNPSKRLVAFDLRRILASIKMQVDRVERNPYEEDGERVMEAIVHGSENGKPFVVRLTWGLDSGDPADMELLSGDLPEENVLLELQEMGGDH